MPNISSEGLVILDVGGVIADSTEPMLDCYHAAISGVGVDLSREEERALIRPDWGAKHSDILDRIIPDREAAKRACALYETCMSSSYIDKVKKFAGSAEVLGELAATYTLAIATAEQPQVLKKKIMPKLGIDPALFKQIESVYGFDSSKDKRTPYLVNKIMRDRGFEPNQTVVAGDAPCDIQMAKESGAKSIAVESGLIRSGLFSREEIEDLQPDDIIPDITHLKNSLGRIGLRPVLAH